MKNKTAVVLMIFGGIILLGLIIAALQSVGIIPNTSATHTAEAKSEAANRAKTPSSTPAPTDTPTATIEPSPTIPTETPTMTPTLSPADKAAQVVRDLHDTDISDNDLRDSTSAYDDRAVLKIFLSQSAVSTEAVIRQVRHDYPLLICALRNAGFTNRVVITGTANFVDAAGNSTEQKAIEVQMDEAKLTALDCADLSSFDILTTNDGLYIHPGVNYDPTAAISGDNTDSVNPSDCPSTCAQAVAQGLSPEQSAACGLDRDQDGVACYGD